ncbi:MAG: hypothetical protein HYV27_15050 [Candidatus Hydrogenedentes bacterium]|nr:hypothetical protein [Candidatus Hydrogenedentota bacterium]
MFELCSGLGALTDKRRNPRVPGGRVAVAHLLLSRLGSLNALEQRRAPASCVKWLGGDLPSADVMGESLAGMELGPLRDLLYRQHKRLKRNKGFTRGREATRFLVLDGHEGVASYKRSWKECLERIVHCASGDKTQSCHRFVAAYLTNGGQYLMLDAERQLPGEGEIACAMRLLERVAERYPAYFTTLRSPDRIRIGNVVNYAQRNVDAGVHWAG